MVSKVDDIRSMIHANRFLELKEFIEGESKYTTDRSTGAPEDAEARQVWIMAIYHLRFLAEIEVNKSALREGRYSRPFPEEFEEWLELGAPGVDGQDIADYLEHNPL